MDACPRYLCTCVYVIVCMSARKKAPVNLLMCPFELYMFIGVSMQLRVVFKYDFLVLIPYCWSVVSPASLLDSQRGCITSPHAKKESGQTPYAVWSPLVQEFLGQGSGFDCCGVRFLFIFADSATTFADSARPNYQRSLTRLLLRVR